MTLTRDIQQFTHTLQSQGAPASLAYLNAGVPHRYSAIYRLHEGQFVNVLLHDKQAAAAPPFLAVVPFEDSFCRFVLHDRPFSTSDSATDPRLHGHRYQGVIASYHGIPLFDEDGEIIGTLGHFDVVPHEIASSEFALLQSAARALPGCLVRGEPAPAGPS